jgi:hypothetical protein
MIKVPQQQIPGVYHHRVGDIVVTAISDGFLDGTLDVLRNISQEGARQILAESFRPARRTAVNAFLIYSDGRLALVDRATTCSRRLAKRWPTSRQQVLTRLTSRPFS